MKNTLFVLLVLASMLLLVGCTGTGAPQQNGTSAPIVNKTIDKNTTPPSPPEPSQTCEQYCPAQPHAQCAGKWNISGDYPACSCGYVCDAIPAKNDTNASTAPPLPTPKPINATVSEILASTMAKTQSDFYRENSGSFKEKSYTWARIAMETDLKDISFASSPGGDVRFDGLAVDSIVASGFTVFENTDDNARVAYGIAILKGMKTVLDEYTGADQFSVDYFPPVIDKKLRDCSVYAKDYYSTTGGDWFVAYSFVCWKVSDK